MARPERKLVAVLAADVAGYSRLMGADEAGTLFHLKSLRAEVIDPKVAQFRGRLVGTAGDSLLIEFPSAVDALQFAVETQERITARNTDLPEHRAWPSEWVSTPARLSWMRRQSTVTA